MKHKLLPLILAAFFFAGSAFAQFGAPSQPAKKDGWWIKVITQKPESQMMAFYLGATRGSYGLWSIWNPGSPTEFDVSDEFKNSPTLFILAQTTSGKKCGFCLMYKSKGVKRFEFDLEDGYEVKQSDEDKECK
jgi:hypothetical protein